jgi:hypothetical protein
MFAYQTCVINNNNNNNLNGRIHFIVNIIKSVRGIFFITQTFKKSGEFYSYPFKSSDIGIFLVSDLSTVISLVSLSNIDKKCVALPYNNDFVIIPMI